jgi:hypothetical protein
VYLKKKAGAAADETEGKMQVRAGGRTGRIIVRLTGDGGCVCVRGGGILAKAGRSCSRRNNSFGS